MKLTYCETVTSSSYEKALEEVMQHTAVALGDMGVPDIDVYCHGRQFAPSSPGVPVHVYEFTLTYRTEE